MKARKTTWCVVLFSASLLFCGCQGPSSFETSVSLVPAAYSGDPDGPAPEPANPLDVLARVETVAANAGLKAYHTSEEEANLLDLADADLLGSSGNSNTKITEYKHPELSVYLTVTRKPEEILILLNHAPDTTGAYNPQAEKLFQSIRNQLVEKLNN